MPSTIDAQLAPLQPHYRPDGSHTESEQLRAVIAQLRMQSHVEGGYFVETDRDPLRVPNPFTAGGGGGNEATSSSSSSSSSDSSRSASTTIHYLLTPKTPLGAFHRNKGRTVHTLHRGRGRYVIVHADEVAGADCPGGYGPEHLSEAERWTGKARVETFVVGPDVLNGERLQWIVDGGKYKSSYLLPDDDGARTESEGLLISETVVPGFEFSDHDFMLEGRLKALVSMDQAREMQWMLRKPD